MHCPTRVAVPLWTIVACLLLALSGPRVAGGQSIASQATPGGRAAATGTPVTVALKTWQLNNGLLVSYARYRVVPGVTVQLWYHVGSKDEGRGVRGVAHMFEHMMFKGSGRVPPERHAQMLGAVGGSVNAFTTEDLTAYHSTVPEQYFEFAMELEAERMRNLALTDETIASEREVVKEEKRLRLENSPVGRAFEALRKLAYRKHPYSWTPAGDIPDLDRVNRDLCERFYDSYYLPNNASLVIVGDVDEKRVRAAVDRYFGSIPRGPSPPRVTEAEPPQMAARQLAAKWPSQLNVVLGAYHIPEASHQDVPALVVLSAILSSGRSSRLHQALVRRRSLALGAGGSASELEHPGLFVIYAYGLPRHDLVAMKQALFEQVALVSREGVERSELEKAKNQLTTRHLSSMQTLWGLAHRIGMSTYLKGDPRSFMEEVEQIDKVRRVDVQRVAKTYLRPENLSLVSVPANRSGGSK